MFIRRSLFRLRILISRWFKKTLTPSFIAVVIGILSTYILLVINGDVFESAPPKDPSFFFGSAAFVGGALAIIVTLNTLLLQNALDKLPARSFKRVGASGKLYSMYLAMAVITLSLFTLGISYVDTANIARTYLLRYGMGLNVWALIIIFLYAQSISSLLDPTAQLKQKTKQIKKKIDSTERLIKRAVKAMSGDDTPKAALEATVRNQMQPTMKDILNDLDDLSGMYFRLIERGDTELAMTCIAAITGSVSYVYGTRKDNALAMPSGQWGFFVPKSDLADFTNKVDEIMMRMWTNALQTNDLESIREIINGYIIMVNSSVTMKHVNYDRDNPLFSHTWGGFKRMFDKGFVSRNEEALFQLSGAVSSIAKYFYLHSNRSSLNYLHFKGILDTHYKLYAHGAVNRDTTLMTQASDGFMGILGVVLVKDMGDKQIDEVMTEKYSEYVRLANTPALQRLLNAGDEIFTQEQLIQGLIMGVAAVDTTIEKVQLFIRASGILIDSLISAATSNNVSTVRINFDRYVMVSGEAALRLLSNPPIDLGDVIKKDLNGLLIKIIKLHEVALLANDFASDDISEDYSQKLSMIGQTASSFNDSSHAIESISSLMKMASWLLENHLNSGAGATHVIYRMVRYAAFIAGYSHSRRRFLVSRQYKASLHTLESRWLQLTFPNGIPQGSVAQSPNLFRYMFDDLLHGFGHSGIPGLLDYPEDIFSNQVSYEQIDTFNNYLWRGIPVADPINHPFTPTVYYY